MLIRAGTITGLAPNDLNSINGLNHYIGMKPIEPAAIPVLAMMPWVIGALAVGAVIVAVTGLRALLIGWLVSFAAAGGAGLVEFYLWSWDYGHNLASDAIIKVPGMTYQPPLIGTKQLLNFTAASWPASGSWFALAAFVCGLLALACGRAGPTPIEYDRADCVVCRMRITDKRLGGEAVSASGKVQQFDAIECLAEYAVHAQGDNTFWVSDFSHPGRLLAAREARFMERTGADGGMGRSLIAFVAADTGKMRVRYGRAPLTWDSIATMARRGTLREPVLAASGE
jgi:copper chaperone NosL